ncbi:uncharacterized protein LOC114711809 [Neltuma alba]|uniref:uncharacterized protein LOC114711809 n=1 Tax=Neltuma alba TaxID=207710 RepID=UPI0010A2B08B|nr:uncharacterized protein LOC114711809 [Prosopis alba]
MEFGIKCGRRERIDVASEEDTSGKKKKRWWRYVLETIDQWLVYKGDWLEEMRGDLSMVAAVISNMTFQAALNPPGNVTQQNVGPGDPPFNLTSPEDRPLGCLPYRDESGHNLSSGPILPGEAMLAYSNEEYFRPFIMYNTICFVASLCVAFLLVSGLPLKHRFVMWMLSAAMGTALACLLNTYLFGLFLIIPYNDYTDDVPIVASWIFAALHLLVILYSIMIFVIWVVKKLKAKSTKSSDHTANNA